MCCFQKILILPWKVDGFGIPLPPLWKYQFSFILTGTSRNFGIRDSHPSPVIVRNIESQCETGGKFTVGGKIASF